MIRCLPTALPCLIALACSVLSAAETEPYEVKPDERPNVLVVLTDDLGYGDIGCYGNEIVQTPNLDRFAQEGLKLTDCYAAAANCSPARTGLMTGRTPYRVGVHNWIPMYSPMHVRKREITIATLLQRSGYATAQVGKWHLCGKFNMPGQPQPSDHGFDYWFATQNNALPNHRNPFNFVRNAQPVGKLEGYSAGIVADEAIRWLTGRRNKQKPFFLFVCFHEPHEPIATAERFEKLYSQFDDPSRRAHHGNITQMDHAFGRLLQTVDDEGLRENTLVFFTSDNGPAITGYHPHGSSGPLRAKKGYVYEGGIRVPGILRWPGHTEPGAVSKQPVSGVDLLPTLCDVAEIPVPGDRAIDGASFLPVLEGEPIQRETPLYWQFNYARGPMKVAIRDGDWKLLATLTGPELSPTSDITAESQRAIKTAELDSFELYNLREDIGEMTERSETNPERFAAMKKQLQRAYRDVRKETPTWPAWESPHYEGQRIEWPDYGRSR